MTTTIDAHTTSDSSLGHDGPPARNWALTVAHHRRREHIGRQLLLLPGAQLLLGRGARCFSNLDVFDVKRASREHARLRVDDEGVLWIRDQDSRNGTFVNGERVTQRALSMGDVVGIGRILLMVHKTRHTARREKNATLLGVSEAFVSARVQADQVATRDTTVLLVGATGTGKTSLAERIHHSSGRSGPLVVISCGAMADDVLVHELFGHVENAFSGAQQPRPGLLESADGGTVLLEEVGDASRRLQASLLRFFDRREVRKMGADKPARIDARIIATSATPIAELLAATAIRPDFASRIQRWQIILAPLADRVEDIGLLIDGFAQRYAGRETGVHHKLALHLLRRAWPGNLAELEAAVEHAVIAGQDDTMIGLPATERSATGSAPKAMVVARDGSWLKPAHHERIELAHRQTLARILQALIERRETRPGKTISVKGLIAAGWPGEQLAGDSGANRVYVALTALRRMGLRDIIVRRKAGYFILPSASLQIADTD